MSTYSVFDCRHYYPQLPSSDKFGVIVPSSHVKSRKCVALILAYFLLLVTGIYKSRLLTELMIRPQPEPIRDFGELIERLTDGRMRLATRTVQQAYFENVNDSTVGQYG